MKTLGPGSTMGEAESVSVVPAAGNTQFTFSLGMGPKQLANASAAIDLVIEVQQLNQWVEVARYSAVNGAPWSGGSAAVAPSLTYVFPLDPTTRTPVLPKRIRGIVENGVNDTNSAGAWNQGDSTFA